MHLYLYIPMKTGLTTTEDLDSLLSLLREENSAISTVFDESSTLLNERGLSNFRFELNGKKVWCDTIHKTTFGSDPRTFIRLRVGSRPSEINEVLKATTTRLGGYYGDNSKHFYSPATDKYVWCYPKGTTFIPYSIGELLRKIETVEPNHPFVELSGGQIDSTEALNYYKELGNKFPDAGFLPIELDESFHFRLDISEEL